MNSLDISILLVISFFIVYSLFRGLVREVFSLLSLVLGLVLGARFYQWAGGRVSRWVDNETMANLIGFLVIFILAVIVIILLGNLTKKFVKAAKLSVEDRILGGVFGLLKGVVVVVCVFLALVSFLPSGHPLLARSKLSPYLMVLGKISLEIVPGKVKDRVGKKWEALAPYWDGAVGKNRSGAEPDFSQEGEE